MKDQFFADYLERLEGLQHWLHKDVQDLPMESMDWSPGPAMNSVAVLLAHIVGVLREGIAIALDASSHLDSFDHNSEHVPFVRYRMQQCNSGIVLFFMCSTVILHFRL